MLQTGNVVISNCTDNQGDDEDLCQVKETVYGKIHGHAPFVLVDLTCAHDMMMNRTTNFLS